MIWGDRYRKLVDGETTKVPIMKRITHVHDYVFSIRCPRRRLPDSAHRQGRKGEPVVKASGARVE